MAADDFRRRPSSARVLAWLGILAVAFGYIEAAVAHYLRMHLYPDGFHDAILLVADPHTVAVEAGRELCTLLVIAAAAALTPGPPMRRFANFVYVFAIWDLTYYAALWLFEGWPASLYAWDLLFVIPVPWFAPVLAPIAISCIGIIGACSVHVILNRRKDLIVPWHSFALVNGALMAWEMRIVIIAAEFGWERGTERRAEAPLAGLVATRAVGPGLGGSTAPGGSASAKCGHTGAETERRGSRLPVREGSWASSRLPVQNSSSGCGAGRAGAMGGARVERPRQARKGRMTWGSVITAITSHLPEHRGHSRTSSS